MKEKISRKEFLKYSGLSLAALVSGLSSGKAENVIRYDELTPSQKDFLTRYAAWLEEFEKFIRVQNESPTDIENNKRLMLLSDEAEYWNAQLQKHLEDAKFVACWRSLIKKTSKIIQ